MFYKIYVPFILRLILCSIIEMPWYSPWSDHIAKSVCKYLLQRYLGQFLEEKLTLDQLTVDLYKGIGIISDVVLDVQVWSLHIILFIVFKTKKLKKNFHV